MNSRMGLSLIMKFTRVLLISVSAAGLSPRLWPRLRRGRQSRSELAAVGKAKGRRRRCREGIRWRGQGGDPGDLGGDRQALGADGQHRVSLRHDRPAADRLAEPDEGQSVDAGQVSAVRLVERASRAVDDRSSLDAGRRQGPGGRAGRAANLARVVRLEPVDRRPQARAGGSREGPVGR